MSKPVRINNDHHHLAEIYLTDIHNTLNELQLLDLHTYFYWQKLEACPICKVSLVAETKQQ